MAKLIENTFRQVNIALVNELATVADLEVDIWAALRGRRDQAVRLPAVLARPGRGRTLHRDRPHLPVVAGAATRGFGLGFVQHALEVNNGMPAYVAGASVTR